MPAARAHTRCRWRRPCLTGGPRRRQSAASRSPRHSSSARRMRSHSCSEDAPPWCPTVQRAMSTSSSMRTVCLGVLLRGREGLLDCELNGGWQCRRRVRGVRMATGDLWRLVAGITTEVAQAVCGPFALDASFDLHGKASSERQYSHLAHNSEASRACTTRRC